MIKKILKSNKYLYNFSLRSYQWVNRHNFVKMIKNKKDFLNHIEQFNYSGKQKSVYCLIEPEHGNIGDIALAYAQKKFLLDNFPDYNIIDITAREYNHYKKYVKRLVKEKDVIVLIGGGSLGDQYIEHENDRRDIINNFPNNLIISFPQSMYFTNTSKGTLELSNSKKCYSNNKNLVLVARDKISFGLMKENFTKNKVLLTPDIVLYLNETKADYNRDRVSLFLRDDVEGIINSEIKENLENMVKKYFEYVEYNDTKINKAVLRNIAEDELTKMFDYFRHSKLVITDRLHGMIFSAITSTPCIVLSNYNHKIKGQYEWIKHLDNIVFCENVDEIEKHIQYLTNIPFCEYDNSYTLGYYKQIIDVISRVGV